LSNNDLLNLLTKDFLDLLAKRFEGSLLLFESLLLILSLFELQTFFRAVLELLAVELLELLDDVLIDGVDHVEDFITSLDQRFNEGRSLDSLLGLTSDEEDVLLSFFHSCNVILEIGLVISRL